MTETNPESILTGMTIENNSNAAAVEQKSPELATTQPKTDISALEAPAANETETSESITETPDADEEALKKANAEAAERVRDRIRADDLQRQLDATKPKEVIPTTEPNINDYKTLEEYQSDYKKWAKEEGKREQRETYTQAEQARQQTELRTKVAAKEAESRAKHPDFDSVINPIVPVIARVPILKDFIAQNPMGTEVAYELAKNPAVLEQLMRGNVWEAGEQLLSMAARLKKPAAVPQSKAADPIKPVGTRETLKPRLSELATKDINGYVALMNKRELKQKQAN